MFSSIIFQTLMSYSSATLLLSLALILNAYYQLFFASRKPPKLHWAPSGRTGVLAAIDASWKSSFDIRAVIDAAKVHLSSGAAVCISTVLEGPVVIIPPRLHKWYMNLDDRSFSHFEYRRDQLQIKYTLADSVEIDNTKLFHRVILRQSRTTVPILHDELQRMKLPANKSYQPWKVYTELADLVTRLQTRIIVGSGLCRDEEFADLFSRWESFIVPSALLIRCSPPLFRHAVGMAVRQFLSWRFFRPLVKKLLPFTSAAVERVVGNELHTSLDQEDSAAYVLVQELAQSTLPGMSEKVEAHKLAAVTINLMFTGSNTAVLLANVLIDLLSYERSEQLIAELREEIGAVTSTLNNDGRFSWSDLERMVLLDSVMRETLRLHSSTILAQERLATEEVTTPDGMVLAAGTKVAVLAAMSNQDEAVYEDCSNFNPYRFLKKERMYTANSEFLSFGTGKRTCPGRWTATAVMKIVLAKLLVEYDFEPLGKRPEPWHLGMFCIPSPFLTVNMRKRMS